MIDLARKDEGVELPNSGYLGTLIAFHKLHCVVSFSSDRPIVALLSEFSPLADGTSKAPPSLPLYIPLLSTSELRADRRSSDTPRTLPRCPTRRGHSQPRPLANFSSAHSCANWDTLNKWAQERAVLNLFEPGYLRHPVLGTVFDGPNTGLTSLIGAVQDS